MSSEPFILPDLNFVLTKARSLQRLHLADAHARGASGSIAARVRSPGACSATASPRSTRTDVSLCRHKSLWRAWSPWTGLAPSESSPTANAFWSTPSDGGGHVASGHEPVASSYGDWRIRTWNGARSNRTHSLPSTPPPWSKRYAASHVEPKHRASRLRLYERLAPRRLFDHRGRYPASPGIILLQSSRRFPTNQQPGTSPRAVARSHTWHFFEVEFEPGSSVRVSGRRSTSSATASRDVHRASSATKLCAKSAPPS